MTSPFNIGGLTETAKRNPAAKPATISETLSSSFDEPEGSLTARRALFNKFDSLIDQAEELTGERLLNPLKFQTGSPKDEKNFLSELDRLREINPNIPSVTSDSIRRDVGFALEQRRTDRASIANREGGFLQGSVGVLGSIGGVLFDPIIMGSMLVGAPAATTVLRAALIEGAVGVGSELAVQGIVQGQREQFGREIDLGEAATNVALAGAGGAAGAAIIRGGIAGTRGLVNKYRALAAAKKTPEGDAAADYLDSIHGIQDLNPFENTARGMTQHLSRFDTEKIRLLSTTGVGRVLRANEPVEAVFEEIVPVPTRPVDPVVSQATNRIEAISIRQAAIATRLNEIDTGLNDFKTLELFKRTDDFKKLQDQLKAGGDRRKLKKINNKLKELEAEGVKKGNVKQILSARKALKKEKKALEAEVKRLDREKRNISNKSEKRQADKPVIQTPAVRAKQIHQEFGNPVLAKQFDDAIEAVDSLAVQVDRARPVPPPTPRPATKSATNIARPIEQSEEEAAIEAEEAIRALDLELEKDIDIDIADELGNIRTVKLKKLLNEVDEDKKLADEIVNCIKGLPF